MLSKRIIRKNRIFDICKNSGTIKPGELFDRVEMIESRNSSVIEQTKVICCGSIGDEELFEDTYKLREYTDKEIEALPVFITYLDTDDEAYWLFHENSAAYDMDDPMPPKVCMKKRVVFASENVKNENN